MSATPPLPTSAARAQSLYRELFDADFTERNRGKLLLLDLDTREYWLAATQRQMADLSRDLPPAAHRFLMRVGFPAAYELGITL